MQHTLSVPNSVSQSSSEAFIAAGEDMHDDILL